MPDPITFHDSQGYTLMVVDPPGTLAQPDELITSSSEIVITFDYPLRQQVMLPFIHRGGFTRRDLFVAIQTGYRQIYNHPETYTIWGHSINDLFLEGAELEHDNLTLIMGS